MQENRSSKPYYSIMNLTIPIPPAPFTGPVLAASGSMGWGSELHGLTSCEDLGGFITPTLTLHPRQGSRPPRTAEAAAGLMYATGLPNPGLHEFCTDILPLLRKKACPLVVSILGKNAEEWSTLAACLEETRAADALELNLTPLALLAENSGSPPDSTELRAHILQAVRAARKACGLPLLAKLPSGCIDAGEAAKAAEEAGADMIATGQAFPALAVRSGAMRFAGIAGLCGPAIKPLALYQTWRAAQSVQIPVVAGGGIMSADDAREFFVAGARAAAVAAAVLIHPDAASTMARALRQQTQQTSMP